MIRKRFSLRKTIIKDINFGLVRMYVTPYPFSSCSWTIFILGLALTKLYRQIVGIQMGTNCAPLVADLFLFCYERDFMKDLSSDNQADVIKAFNSTSRYLDDLLNIDNPYLKFPQKPSFSASFDAEISCGVLGLHFRIMRKI